MASKIARPGGETPIRSESSASVGAQPAGVFRARVLTVNTRDFTVDVQFESYPYSNHFDIPWMSPYVHQVQGEGINWMPEVGSTCWVCMPSETGRGAFVLGWTIVDEEGSYRGGRELLNPGDMHFSTRDGNFVTIRRGGIIQLGATPVCQRIYLPLRNVIRDFAENYELATPGGDLTWQVMRTDEQGDGHRGTLFTLAAKEYADDPNKDPIALLKIGSHGEGNETILSLETRDKGGGAVKTKLEVSKTGEVLWKIEDNLSLDVGGDLSATVKGKTTVMSSLDMALESKTFLSARAPTVSLAGGGAKLELSDTAKLDGSVVNLGAATAPVVIDNGSLGAWIQAVSALLTGPPSVIAFKGVLPPVIHKSTKVKA